MKIRRTLATAVVAAVVAPVALLSVTAPAFAATARPAAQAQAQSKPTIAELEKAAADAQKAYDDAVIAEKAGQEAFKKYTETPNELTIKVDETKKAATAAADAQVIAEQALADARDALINLPDTATEEEKAAAKQAIADAATAVTAAADAKTKADEEYRKAGDANDDDLVAHSKVLALLQKAVRDALDTKNAADKALADAKAAEDPDCVVAPKFGAVAKGLPSKIVAGQWVGFSLRVTNGTAKTVDAVLPFAMFHAMDDTGTVDYDKLVTLQWYDTASASWKTVGGDHLAGEHGALKAGAHLDVKLRVKIDAKVKSGGGMAFVTGAYANEDGTCGGDTGSEYEFEILPAGSKPGKVDDAEPNDSHPSLPGDKPQGGNSGQVKDTSGADSAADGSLAKTGSPSALPQIALAGGAAAALGAGAVFVVRRRKAGADA
ncbi:LPXTG cell wall anchor domain-containing protein [Streptomyces sp. NBC_01465]|uniref:LPXTG cell wall anchor domain-containing protein n=1 Tax=Streptomyces sp. NBC_01465 TaxID=2903878 RepID=UPI002E2FCA8D|nr:LPXTG cell wall anchor domain-containing protein [Streptomyces sp. NBC_01465]